MSRATSASSHPTASRYPRSRRRQALNRSSLSAGFDLLCVSPAPSLPPIYVDPSSSSRSPSPPPGSKRKPDSDLDDLHHKKPRTVRYSVTPRPASSSAPKAGPSSSHARYDPSEDGELLEDFPTSNNVSEPAFLPVRRPRRVREDIDFQALHKKYQALGRLYKFSGEARVNATYPSKHPHYRPLRRPPHPNSPYQKHANILARLEMIEGLMCFAYAFWCSDMERGRSIVADWKTMSSFMIYCKGHWPLSTTDDREKAISGLVYMLQAYIAGLVVRAETGNVGTEQAADLERLTNMHKAEKEDQARKEHAALQSRATPPMLPSPASITTGSANSTPASRSTPPKHEPKPEPNGSSSGKSTQQPKQREVLSPHLTIPLNGQTLDRWFSFTSVVKDSIECMNKAQRALTLPALAKYFPRTFARMVHTSYSVEDEYQPDFEDEDGELFWPSQFMAGLGIAWVCHLGRSMVRELGREYSYRGQEGLISKADEDGPLVTPSLNDVCSPHTTSVALPSDRR